MSRFGRRYGYVHTLDIVVGFDPVSYEPGLYDGEAVLTIVRAGPAYPVSVSWTSSNGHQGTVSWESGDPGAKQITVPFAPVTLEDLHFTVTLSDPTFLYTVLMPAEAEVDIQVPPIYVGFDPTTYEVEVTDDQVVLAVEKFGLIPLTVTWTTTAGTTGTLSWDASDQEPKTITLDRQAETYERPEFQVELSNLSSPFGYISEPLADVTVLPLLITSRPYPIDDIESMQMQQIAAAHGAIYSPPLEGVQLANPFFVSGQLRQILKSYTLWPAEGVQFGSIAFVSGEMRQILKTYTNWPAEGVQMAMPAFVTGSMERLLVKYENWPVEGVQMKQISFVSGAFS